MRVREGRQCPDKDKVVCQRTARSDNPQSLKEKKKICFRRWQARLLRADLCVRACVCAYMRVYVRMCEYARMCVCVVHVCRCVCAYVRAYMWLCAWMYVCMCVFVYMCMCVCVYVCMCVCVYVCMCENATLICVNMCLYVRMCECEYAIIEKCIKLMEKKGKKNNSENEPKEIFHC